VAGEPGRRQKAEHPVGLLVAVTRQQMLVLERAGAVGQVDVRQAGPPVAREL
jgi:hypothetical protein